VLELEQFLPVDFSTADLLSHIGFLEQYQPHFFGPVLNREDANRLV
jgi:hypothetical protein